MQFSSRRKRGASGNLLLSGTSQSCLLYHLAGLQYRAQLFKRWIVLCQSPPDKTLSTRLFCDCGSPNSYPLDSDLSGGQHHPAIKQLVPVLQQSAMNSTRVLHPVINQLITSHVHKDSCLTKTRYLFKFQSATSPSVFIALILIQRTKILQLASINCILDFKKSQNFVEPFPHLYSGERAGTLFPARETWV